MSHGVDHRRASWLWLWCRLAAAALIRPLAWEPPCAMGVALKKTTTTTTKNIEKKKSVLAHWKHNLFLGTSKSCLITACS